MTLEPIRRTITGACSRERDWGEVLFWEPPARVVLSWRIDVRFVEEGPRSTRVELEHRGFERHGETASKVRDGVSPDGGHGGLLKRFAGKAAA